MSDPSEKAGHRSLDDWLSDVQSSIRLIEKNTAGKTIEEFTSDIVLRDHVERRLTNIGEACKYIDRYFPDFQRTAPQIPWKDFARTRDKVNHGYFTLSPQRILVMAQQQIPIIRAEMDKLMNARAAARAMAAQQQLGR